MESEASDGAPTAVPRAPRPRRDAEAAASYAELARTVASTVGSTAPHEEVERALCRAALRVVDGCEHASLQVRGPHRHRVHVSSDIAASLTASLEGTGPQPSGPDHAHAGFGLWWGGEEVGRLHVFGATAEGLTERSVQQAEGLAAFGSVTLAALRQATEAATLRDGLQSNREIGKALGLLMVTHHLDEHGAFEALRSLSQSLNVKLVEVARRVVERHGQGDLVG